MQANVVVAGSLNMDLVTRTERLPRPGETVFGQSFATVHGGKGLAEYRFPRARQSFGTRDQIHIQTACNHNIRLHVSTLIQ